jgi:hypothetical protein
MSQGPTVAVDAPPVPVLRCPKGPAVWSLQRSDADALVLAPARATGWPARANTSLAGWLALWFLLGGLLLLGGLSWGAILAATVTLPAYWTMNAFGCGAWSEAAADSVTALPHAPRAAASAR